MTDRMRMEEREALLLSPLQLAYMGDAVWEITVRSRLLFLKRNVRHMHAECVGAVNAAAQARFLARILPELSDTEKQVYLRGRNAHPHHPSPRHQDPGDYADATGFEAVMGFLFLTGQDARLKELENRIWESQEGTEKGKKDGGTEASEG